MKSWKVEHIGLEKTSRMPKSNISQGRRTYSSNNLPQPGPNHIMESRQAGWAWVYNKFTTNRTWTWCQMAAFRWFSLRTIMAAWWDSQGGAGHQSQEYNICKILLLLLCNKPYQLKIRILLLNKKTHRCQQQTLLLIIIAVPYNYRVLHLMEVKIKIIILVIKHKWLCPVHLLPI